MSRVVAFFAALLIASTLAAQSLPQQQPSTAQALGQVNVEHNVDYGSAPGSGLLVDIYEPSDRGATNRPAILLIHGGGWIAFDKSTMRAMGEFLANSGFVAFSVDYRLFQGPSTNRWPAQLDDVQRAVRWIRANAAKYGVDPQHVGAFGHSAGAQLASLLGMEDTRDNSDPALAKYSSRVQAVVDVSGPGDFTIDHDPESVAFLTSFLGGDFATHPEIWRAASPAFHVAKDAAPFLIYHGTQDMSVPIAQAQELYDKLKAAGATVTFTKVDDAHTFRKPEIRRQLAIDSLDFFHRYLIDAK